MFGFIKDKFKKIYNTFTSQVNTLFSRNKVDEQFLQELSVLLICADTGVKTTAQIIDKLRKDLPKITDPEQVKVELENLLVEKLNVEASPVLMPKITLLVGVNGSGKTTFAAKFANLLRLQNKRVLLVAGDTFRAAATQQLSEWGTKINVPVFVGRESQDPASVIFDACKKFGQENFDHLIIDTAGRLQTKVNLMKEIEKIRKTLDRQLPGQEICTWLTIDSMNGQNSLRQAEIFKEATELNGVILTKLDGTGKGGIVFSVTEQFKIPILYITLGEKIEDIKIFDAREYVHGLLYE